jgi:hypothetical protein
VRSASRAPARNPDVELSGDAVYPDLRRPWRYLTATAVGQTRDTLGGASSRSTDEAPDVVEGPKAAALRISEANEIKSIE